MLRCVLLCCAWLCFAVVVWFALLCCLRVVLSLVLLCGEPFRMPCAMLCSAVMCFTVVLYFALLCCAVLFVCFAVACVIAEPSRAHVAEPSRASCALFLLVFIPSKGRHYRVFEVIPLGILPGCPVLCCAVLCCALLLCSGLLCCVVCVLFFHLCSSVGSLLGCLVLCFALL